MAHVACCIDMLTGLVLQKTGSSVVWLVLTATWPQVALSFSEDSLSSDGTIISVTPVIKTVRSWWMSSITYKNIILVNSTKVLIAATYYIFSTFVSNMKNEYQSFVLWWTTITGKWFCLLLNLKCYNSCIFCWTF